MGRNFNIKKWLFPSLILIISLVLFGLLFFMKELNLSGWKNGKSPAQVPDKMVQVSEKEEIKGGVHVATGLVAAEGLNEVIANCTGCHSAKLIIQNRATREGWVKVIRWMQETQNL